MAIEDYKFHFDDKTKVFGVAGPTLAKIKDDVAISIARDHDGKIRRALLDLGWTPPDDNASTRITELEAFVKKARDFYHDHRNIVPEPIAPGADHSDRNHTWGRGAWFETESRRLLGLE
jgi:hypothetical protein